MNEEPEVLFEALEPIEPRFCREPVAMAALMGESKFPDGVPDPKKATHPFDGLCKICGATLPEPLWREIIGCRGWYPVNCCYACYENSKGDAELRIRQRSQWERICPPEFRKDWDSRLGNEPLLRAVRAFDPKLRRGMLIHGASGSCKTRAAWLLVRQLMERGFEVAFVASIDLPDENLKDMMHAPILVIDDLGNDKMQASREAVLLKVLRNRVEWHRPTIVTTQFTGASLEERFSDAHTAKAVIRRLREYCDGVTA
jgi:hypothetical protein